MRAQRTETIDRSGTHVIVESETEESIIDRLRRYVRFYDDELRRARSFPGQMEAYGRGHRAGWRFHGAIATVRRAKYLATLSPERRAALEADLAGIDRVVVYAKDLGA